MLACACGVCCRQPAGSLALSEMPPLPDTVMAIIPESTAVSGCNFTWKAVAGDSTVLIATANLRALADGQPTIHRAVVVPHIQPPRQGYVLAMSAPAGALRVESRGALAVQVDSTATRALIVAADDSATVAAYEARISAALRACRRRQN